MKSPIELVGKGGCWMLMGKESEPVSLAGSRMLRVTAGVVRIAVVRLLGLCTGLLDTFPLQKCTTCGICSLSH